MREMRGLVQTYERRSRARSHNFAEACGHHRIALGIKQQQGSREGFAAGLPFTQLVLEFPDRSDRHDFGEMFDESLRTLRSRQWSAVFTRLLQRFERFVPVV